MNRFKRLLGSQKGQANLGTVLTVCLIVLVVIVILVVVTGHA